MFRKKRTVNSIVMDIADMVGELEDLKAEQITEANKEQEVINIATARRQEHLQEADHAASVGEKLTYLITQ